MTIAYKYTKQEAFDRVVEKLLAQGQRALKSPDSIGVCCYCTPKGRRCAAGWLVPDGHALLKTSNNTMNWHDACGSYPDLKLLAPEHFVISLQVLHDRTDGTIKLFRTKFALRAHTFAKEWHLETDKLRTEAAKYGIAI